MGVMKGCDLQLAKRQRMTLPCAFINNAWREKLASHEPVTNSPGRSAFQPDAISNCRRWLLLLTSEPRFAKSMVSLLYACMVWGAAIRSFAQTTYEYDFVALTGTHIVDGLCSIYLDVPNGTNGTSANVLSWNLNGDGLNWTPNNSTVSGNVISWDDTFMIPDFLTFTSTTNYVSGPGGYYKLQFLTFFTPIELSGPGCFLRDNGPLGGSQDGVWVTTVPEPNTAAIFPLGLLLAVCKHKKKRVPQNSSFNVFRLRKL